MNEIAGDFRVLLEQMQRSATLMATIQQKVAEVLVAAVAELGPIDIQAAFSIARSAAS